MNNRPQPGIRTHRPGRYDEHTVPPRPSAGRESAEPRTRRGTLQWLPLALGALAGVALVIVAMAIISHLSGSTSRPSVNPTAQRICDDLTSQQYSDLYTLLSQAEKSLGPGDQFAASQRQLDAQLGTARGCTYRVASQDAASATLTLTLTRGSSPPASGQVRLIFEQNGWRIAEYDSSLVVAPVSPLSRAWSKSQSG